jgi:hypothetical protein
MVFLGHGAVDPLTQDEMQKKIMLERFQEGIYLVIILVVRKCLCLCEISIQNTCRESGI